MFRRLGHLAPFLEAGDSGTHKAAKETEDGAHKVTDKTDPVYFSPDATLEGELF